MTTLELDSHARSWSNGRVVAGGSPWRLSLLAPPAAAIMQRLRRGPSDAARFDDRAVRTLLARGLVHPRPPTAGDRKPVGDLTVAIPVYDDADGLRLALSSLTGHRAIVIDDGSADPRRIAQACSDFGATLIVHDRNLGPAAARNTALEATRTEYIAFLDSDCTATQAWPSSALWHFDDTTVAAVAPRITSSPSGQPWIDRYESVRGTLDMGSAPTLVRPGARVGYVPGAALVARTDVLRSLRFDESLRQGEDVDLVWRLADAGGLVRYDPTGIVQHRNRATWPDWMRQRYTYGTSVPVLDQRHPGRLAPWRPSLLDAASLGLLAAGHPLAALVPVAITGGFVHAGLRPETHSIDAAVDITLHGWTNDARVIGNALRREWWPVGAAACVALALRPSWPAARVAVACMVVPVIADWWQVRDRIPLPHYAAMRTLDDASYGTGVIRAVLRDRRWRALAPRLMPIRRRPGRSRRPARAPSVGR